METPLRISFQNMKPSPSIESRISEKVAKFEQFYPRIVGCSVVVEAPHRYHRKGKLYNVRITITVPGKDIHVGHTGPQDHSHEDINVAIRDAFNAAGRLLEDHDRIMRGEVKTHAVPDHGKVVRLAEDHGFVKTSGGEEIYFHRNSVIGSFDDLSVGSEVRIVISETEGDKGLQASTVIPVGKHHIVS